MSFHTTAPKPPGLFCTVTGTGTIFASCSTLALDRQVRSQPPPGLAGAMSSTALLGYAARAKLPLSNTIANPAAIQVQTRFMLHLLA